MISKKNSKTQCCDCKDSFKFKIFIYFKFIYSSADLPLVCNNNKNIN